MSKRITGGCLCGAVKFSLESRVKAFYLCHCEQCKRLTGSAFAANILTGIDNIEWHSGKRNISKYEHASREFSKSFCKQCGSALPVVNKTGTSLVVPAGSLDEQPNLKPQANVFALEEASWLSDGIAGKKYSRFANK
jgi:hypothetical protein